MLMLREYATDDFSGVSTWTIVLVNNQIYKPTLEEIGWITAELRRENNENS
jgi:hypothetical protein